MVISASAYVDLPARGNPGGAFSVRLVLGVPRSAGAESAIGYVSSVMSCQQDLEATSAKTSRHFPDIRQRPRLADGSSIRASGRLHRTVSRNRQHHAGNIWLCGSVDPAGQKCGTGHAAPVPEGAGSAPCPDGQRAMIRPPSAPRLTPPTRALDPPAGGSVRCSVSRRPVDPAFAGFSGQRPAGFLASMGKGPFTGGWR